MFGEIDTISLLRCLISIVSIPVSLVFAVVAAVAADDVQVWMLQCWNGRFTHTHRDLFIRAR